ncbi:branched-chain amino acid ABC transporter permease [Natrinema gelatinilyticum]|uniref:branched-chain amino acid ABC transporter permease n=1 Tax=Natrinema gelatinilyticum TaxID=2961571 RepID=UPI0020C2FB01|nr:branched-chain amino acid ABC transporter permease [Natrinema gelatinilyticum]
MVVPPTTGIPNAVLTGIVTGSIIAMGAIGLALVYSIAEVPNFAHGELLMIGAFIALFVNKPGTVPLFQEWTTGARSVSSGGFVALFLLGGLGVLAILYLLDGRDALRGSWWPRRPPTSVAFVVHLLLAVVVGAVIAFGVPSIWAGILLAAVLVGVIAPLTEKIVYRKFRETDAELATMLIVSLGVSFILRFGTQAIYGGRSRSFELPPVSDVFGTTVYVTAAKFLDFYVTASGLVLQFRDSGPTSQEGLNSVPVFTLGYPWPLVVVLLLLVTGLTVAAYVYRKRMADYTEAQTIGPKLTGAIMFVVSLAVFGWLLAGSRTVPQTAAGFIYATRLRIFPLKMLIILIALAMMASLHVLLQETKLGTAMRASSGNLNLAQVTGINTDRVMMATWIIAGVFAGIAGVLLGLTLSRVQVNIGFFLLLPMFAGVILGGIRSIYGVIIGSFVVGLAMDIGFTILPVGNNYRIPIAFVVLFMVLLVKPEGIVGGS